MCIKNHCRSVCTIAEFLMLLRNLYQLEPVHCPEIQEMIAELFAGESFGKFLTIHNSTRLKNTLYSVQDDLKSLNLRFKSNGAASDQEGELLDLDFMV